MSTHPNILVSGFYCGPSPSAGLGIARSLRAAWPDANIVGMDHWEGSSGLHDTCLSDRLVFPSWDVLDHDAHAATLERLCETRHLISALDIEIRWYAERGITPRKRLTPTLEALAFADKPRVGVHELLPFTLPESFRDSGDDQSLYDFCRRHSWRVWVKGRYHGARFVASWRELDAARRALAPDGDFSEISYQAHVRGVEESICFVAYQGELLDAVHMRKHVTTPDGKTWSGKVLPLSPRQRAIIQTACQRMNWTGGGELELVRDESDRFWLMEFNPRFPAWVHGATLAGHNLPAKLVEAATGLAPAVKPATVSDQFTRVVREIPVLAELSLPPVRQPEHGEIGAIGKYGASYGALERRLAETRPQANNETPLLANQDSRNDVQPWLAAARETTSTPTRLRLDDTLRDHLDFAASLHTHQEDDVALQVAYSVKTCPDTRYLASAHERGLLAEAISMAEVEAALAIGWRASDIILNGPAKWWPRSMSEHQGLAAVFCDSLDELDRLITSERRDTLWGVRLRIPGFASRFGVQIDDLDDFERLVDLTRSIPSDIKFGVHIHLASNLVGNGHWQDAARAALHWADAVARTANRPISAIDFGGGYHPRDFRHIPWDSLVRAAKSRLPGLERIYVEPGRALSQDTMVVVTTVQDVRRRGSLVREVVVDTCIADLPVIKSYPHRLYLLRDGQATSLSHGPTRILGRVCMEDDVIAESVTVPNDLKPGDRLIVADAGGYDRSMSYVFGIGSTGATL